MTSWKRCTALVSLVGLLAGLLGDPATPSPPATESASVRVIIQAPGEEAETAATVRRLGGAVTRALPIVSGFAATVPAPAVDEVAGLPGVRAVTSDHRVEVADGSDPYEQSGNTRTINSVFVRTVGADDLAQQGLTGEGARIALVDTGISAEVADSGELDGRVVPVADPYDASGPRVPCANFSGEDTCDDTFGHGTFMAGLIAGSGAASDGRFRGVAPEAEIVSVKVGGADGSAHVSKVLAGIQWTVSFADEYDIEVMNLSLGSDSTVHYHTDPLNLAVQRAWVSGLTVVVSAGNRGRGPRTAPDGTEFGTVTKPGDDPYVITVGAVDDRETPTAPDDRLPAFSSWGPTRHEVDKPDVVAPGARTVSLRAPGSRIDELPGILEGTPYRRGSGTSMAAAITSGLAALLLEASEEDGRASWRPDDVKAALVAGAQDARFDDPRAVGAGMVHGPSALAADIDPDYRTSVLADGSGRLEDSAGEFSRAEDPECDGPATRLQRLLAGQDSELTAQCNVWDAGAYRESEWNPDTWYESQWVTGLAGHNWEASTWAEGHNWEGHNWEGSSWNNQSDDEDYGEPIPGSASYGVWD